MPYTIPKKRKVLRTIKINNGTLTAEVDDDENVYWFRNGKYITPHQMKNYRYYDSSIKGYRTLDDKVHTDFDKNEDTVYSPVFTPTLNKINTDNREKRKDLYNQEFAQSIPLENQEWVTLRTKGNMNLADFPINGLDSIAINAGRSNTDFWTDAALIGKESTFGGYSKYLGREAPIIGKLYVHELTNNHAYFNTAEDDYITASYKKYNHYDDAQLVKAENDAKYAVEHGLVQDKVPHYSKYILADAFKRYEAAPTQYNPGQKNYVPMLNGIRQELMGEKQLQQYWNTRGKEYYAKGQQEGMAYGGFLQPKDAWDKLSMREKAEMMKVAVRNGIYNLNDIREKYNEFAEGGDTVGEFVDAIYENNPREEYLGEPSHHYDFTQSEEWANAHGYYPDARGHRDDRVKKPAHPSHPSRGTWDGDKFVLTDLGIQDPNYTMFGLVDGGQDPQAILTYKGGVVLPEITVTPQGNYFFNPYDNIELHTKAHGGSIHIKHPGRLTALKKRTGKTEAELYRTGGPAVRKMITFARNARKWKHGLGGNLFSGEEEGSQQMNIFRRPSGEYFYQAYPGSEEITVVPMIKVSDDPAYWTYADAEGKLYTPKQTTTSTQEEVIQTEAPSTWENIIATSNNNYMDPVLGAPARWKASWDNNTNAIRALWDNPAIMGHPLGMAAKAVEHLAGDEGISKTIRLYQNSDGSDNARWLWQRSLAGDALESLGLLPAVGMGYNAAKPVIDRTVTTLQNNYPALFDPYTSWDATLGYHGDNIFSRAVGTVGRRYGYTPKAEVPEFHRRLTINRPSQLKLDEEGNMIISSGRTGEGHDGIVNFATSEPARGHSRHKSLSGIDDYIIDSKAIGNQDFKSIHPSDTFFETGQLAIDPKSMTLVSGNTEMLDYARSLGMRTLSSPRLRQLTASRMTKEDIINSRSEGIAKFLQNVGEIKYGKGQQNAGQIGEEMQRLTSMRGTPTMQDYSYFEGLTGLNSGVRPAEMWNGTKEQGLELFGNWGKPRRTPIFNHVAYAPASNIEAIYREAKLGIRPWEDYYAALERMPSARQQLGLNSAMDTYPAPQITAENAASITPELRYDLPSSDIIIESSTSANPNIPFDEAWLAASKGRHQMSNLVGSDDYAGRVRQAYQDNGIPVNQADFEILQAKQGIEDSNLKVVPNLKSENGEVLNGQYDSNTRQVLVSQDRDNILDVVESSGHEHAHASEVDKLLELLKEKWKHIKPRKEAFTRSDGSVDTEWKDYISKIVEMRAPAMSVWSEMKDLGFSKVGDYLHHLKRFGLEDKQWEALVNRYGLTNAKYMVETVFGVSPFVISGVNNEEKDSTTM